MYQDRAAIGYDHGYYVEVFYLGLVFDDKYVEGFVEGCLERIGEDDPDEEDFLRGAGRTVATGASSWRSSRAASRSGAGVLDELAWGSKTNSRFDERVMMFRGVKLRYWNGEK